MCKNTRHNKSLHAIILDNPVNCKRKMLFHAVSRCGADTDPDGFADFTGRLDRDLVEDPFTVASP
jgi:hypothetical protein